MAIDRQVFSATKESLESPDVPLAGWTCPLSLDVWWNYIAIQDQEQYNFAGQTIVSLDYKSHAISLPAMQWIMIKQIPNPDTALDIGGM